MKYVHGLGRIVVNIHYNVVFGLDRPQQRSTSDAIAPSIAILTIAVQSRRPSSRFVYFVFSFFFSKHQKIFFRKFFEMLTKHMKIFSFPKNSISRKWNIFRKCFYTNQTQPNSQSYECERERKRARALKS